MSIFNLIKSVGDASKLWYIRNYGHIFNVTITKFSAHHKSRNLSTTPGAVSLKSSMVIVPLEVFIIYSKFKKFKIKIMYAKV